MEVPWHKREERELREEEVMEVLMRGKPQGKKKGGKGRRGRR